MAQVEEAKDHLQKAKNGGQMKKSELVLGVNTVQAVETRVCNNPNCGVTFTPEKPCVILAIVTRVVSAEMTV
jgi:hypothetical protein